MTETPREPRLRVGAGQIRLGAQGWNYDAWLGGFYPSGTRVADFLGVYSRAFDTVEVDSTFYATPPETTVQGWVRRTPPGFVFSLKVPQVITHEKKLRRAEEETAEFIGRVRALGDKLGPILLQMGPDFDVADLPVLATFLATLPDDLRIAIEFRHRSWMGRDVHAMLANHGVALCLSDGPWIPRELTLKLVEHPTADFHYVRWMGPDRSITDHSRPQVDRTRDLEAWAELLKRVAATGRDIFGYTSNYYEGHGPHTTRVLQRAVGQRPVAPDSLGSQMSLF
jgi:uncharacterized protein YecE (DUF72 family)